MDLHGTIAVDSTPGKGKWITVDMPAAVRRGHEARAIVDDVPAWRSNMRTTSSGSAGIRRVSRPVAKRPRGARPGANRLRGPRPRDAGYRRFRRSATHAASRPRYTGDRLYRNWQLRPLRPSCSARRVRVRRQGRAHRTRGSGDRQRCVTGDSSASCDRCGPGWTTAASRSSVTADRCDRSVMRLHAWRRFRAAS